MTVDTHPAEKVAEVKKVLQQEGWLEKVDDVMINRFLTADSGNVGHACKRLVKTLKWRSESLPDPMVCKACAKDYKSHYMHPVGFDKLGRPVIYSVFALASDHTLQPNVEHMIHCFEHAISLMGPDVSKWVWIADFNGFGFKNLNPQIALAANNLFSVYYPERLGLFVIVGAPRMFDALWKMVAPVLDPLTAQKIAFCKKDPESMKKLFSEHFDDELLQWCLTEIAQNTDKTLRGQKKYAGTDVSGWGSFENMDESPALRPESSVEGHNVYGTQSLINAVRSKPLEWQRLFHHYS
mmetsp:Transcript_25162/g.51180  ORF Transcript_25162/g.51180 Transcript_25162/m.51180 type:complete len:295 (-) Transcript_25162:120-1004(-)|eukprot:CAMPEP_0181289610 /NCGR_PEP_ID=MMETSP1101-20121128/970_1 /TAXON_ID=46948 /ORGANISM="Rhodomonas abbreviata, Strain Caron Lab Isolate" /LENGTH=294 /DNA_ID=CAMNT_0023393835 /DNA_START=42 /DNA_END=926 /DNA_ORIENTATION=+